MTAIPHRSVHDILRWGICAVIVAAAHGALGACLLWPEEAASGGEPSGAFVVELAEMAVMRPDIPLDIAPGPDQVQSQASPELRAEEKADKPEDTHKPEAEDKPLPVLPAVQEAEAALPAARKEEQEEQQPSQPQTPAPATTATQAIAERLGPVAMAPLRTAPRRADPDAVPNWQSLLQTLLEHNKRYPAAAQARQERGVVLLSFEMDRRGKLVSSRVARSSGHAALDAEALALLARAEPFPAPPPELPGAQVKVAVPIRFNLR